MRSSRPYADINKELPRVDRRLLFWYIIGGREEAMDDRQAKDLSVYLAGVLGGPFTSETTVHFTLYANIRDTAADMGAEAVYKRLAPMADLEESEGYVHDRVYSDIKDILFGDPSLTPPLMDKYPVLCKWRLARVAREGKEKAGVV